MGDDRLESGASLPVGDLKNQAEELRLFLGGGEAPQGVTEARDRAATNALLTTNYH